MESAIKLSVEHKYALHRELGPARILGIGPREAVVYYAPRDEDWRYRGRCVLEHLHDGVAERHELLVDPDLLQDSQLSLSKIEPVLIKLGGRLMLLVNQRLLYVIDPALRVIERYPIENELPVPNDPRFNGGCLYADGIAGFSDTNVVTVFFAGDWMSPRAVHKFGLLQIEPEKKSARWTEVDGKLLFCLENGDFPGTRQDHASPLIHHAVWRKGRLQVYVIGTTFNYAKWGMDYFGLATLDGRFRPIEKPCIELVPPGDYKRRGRYGEFTSSLEYCILTPLAKSDPWKTSQRLLDLESRQLHEVVLPRGFSKYDLVEHAHDTYWLQPGAYGSQLAEIVSCSRK